MPLRAGLEPLLPRRLYQQLVLVVSLLLLLAIVLLGAYTLVKQTRIARDSHLAQAGALARNLAISSANSILTDSLDVLEELALRSAEFPHVLEIHLVDAQGQVLSHVVKTAAGQSKLRIHPPHTQLALPPPTSSAPWFDVQADSPRIVAWYPVTAGKLIGWVRVDYSTAALQDISANIWASTVIVAVLATGLSGALLMWFLRAPIKVLERATAFAVSLDQVGGQQLALQPGADELMDLCRALNGASARLHQQMLTIESSVQQLRAQDAALSDQNEQLQAIFALSPDGLVTFDRQDRIRFANAAFLQMTGLERDAVVDQPLAQLDGQLRALALERASFAGLDACFSTAGTRVHHADTLTLSQPQETVLDLVGLRSQSASVGKVLYARNVTQQFVLDRMKSEFLSMAAHELRTPMASIYGFTELMLGRELKPEQRQDLLGSIHRQCKVMIAIINELLDLARIEAGRGKDFKFESVDLAESVQAVVADFKPGPERTAPQWQAPQQAMRVWVDRQKMQQAVLNLLSNAYKYSHAGTAVTISLVQRGEAGPLRRFGVRVSDQGIGLSPQDLARMGERFFRVDKSGHIPGTGLGVSIVKELVQLMGGEMEVASQLGQGSDFTLWFKPARAAADAAAGSAPAATAAQ